MGISSVFKLFPSLCFSVVVVFFILLVTNFSFLLASSSSSTANYSSVITPTLDTDNHHGQMVYSSNPPISLAPPPQQLFKSKTASFKPSVAVIVGVLTTIFSITFLLLLYAKHCRRVDRSNAFFFNNSVGYPPSATTTARKNSGIDRAVIDSLPIFRFGSLRGQKDGLECAVCLNRFEPTEVLRLLPKCKHAFHVECVDTWLDAHSTCPLCRYRVDPEDILLVEDNRIMYQNDVSKVPPSMQQSPRELGSVAAARVSGRHSFAGSSLEVIAERGKPDSTTTTTSSSFVPRRSLDSWNSKKKRNSEIVAVGCFDRPRKDGLLLADKTSSTTSAEQRRLEHRIIVSGVAELGGSDGPNRRWSDVQASDLLFLGSEMILSDSRRFMGSSRGSRPSVSGSGGGIDERNGSNSHIGGGSRNEINARSVSEITGLSRFRSNEQQYEYQQRQQRQAEQRQRQAGAVSRWLAWISQPQTQHQQQQQKNPTLHPPPSSSSPPFSSSSSSLATSTMV